MPKGLYARLASKGGGQHRIAELILSDLIVGYIRYYR
jgi:hypothetical protein